MKQGDLYTKVRRETPADEVFNGTKLLIRGGYIHKEISGVYSILPIGLRVLNKIQNIVREEMNNIGGQEIEMSSLQDSEIWKKTNRWDDEIVDNWFKTKLNNDNILGLAFTHEEPITFMMREHLNSYKDLPVFVYQFQKKFRNELRAKSGILRGREFLMKDLYSFCLNQAEQDLMYEKARNAYVKIFEKVGIGHITFITKASGGVFSKFSEEFQTICEAGEDKIYLDEKQNIAINDEIYNDEMLAELNMKKSELKELKTVEVGNIFDLGTKFSDPLELKVTNKEGKNLSVIMGSYGIGIGRLMGVIAETYSTESGIVWPKNVAPFDVHILQLTFDEESNQKVKEIEKLLSENNLDYLTDDRDKGAGEKFGDAEIIGVSNWIIIGKDVLGTDQIVFRNRNINSEKTTEEKIKITELITKLK
jgi:prolyl-tRNA synthetase